MRAFVNCHKRLNAFTHLPLTMTLDISALVWRYTFFWASSIIFSYFESGNKKQMVKKFLNALIFGLGTPMLKLWNGGKYLFLYWVTHTFLLNRENLSKKTCTSSLFVLVMEIDHVWECLSRGTLGREIWIMLQNLKHLNWHYIDKQKHKQRWQKIFYILSCSFYDFWKQTSAH